MEEPQAMFAHNTFKFTFKFSNSKANTTSFCALLTCVFVYISIFYIFNLSPRVLFNTSKFWFLISNTLILIIAADSGAFSSSKNNPIPLNHQLIVATPHYNFQAFETPLKYKDINVVVQEKEKNNVPKTQPETITIIDKVDESKKESQECILSTNNGDHEVTKEVKSCQRSESAKSIRNENEKIGLYRSSSEKLDEGKNVDDENDRFSSLSDEELNKRVEEFIRRFYDEQLMKPQRRRKVGQMY